MSKIEKAQQRARIHTARARLLTARATEEIARDAMNTTRNAFVAGEIPGTPEQQVADFTSRVRAWEEAVLALHSAGLELDEAKNPKPSPVPGAAPEETHGADAATA